MATVVTFTPFPARMRLVGDDAAYHIALRATLATVVHATRTVPVLTGELRYSQRHRIRRLGLRSVGTIWYTADHAASVHEGSRPHIIKPRRPGGVLVFRVGGKTVYAKRVRHPGGPSQPWLFRALLAEAGRLGFRVTPR